jgi:serralysin
MPTLTVGPTGGFNDLEDAVAAAAPGDTIILQAGTINLEDAGDAGADGILGHVTIDKDLTIIGAGAGATTLVAVNDNPNAQNEAIGGALDRALGAAMEVDGAGVSVLFANFTFDGQDGPDAGGLDLGSGIFFDNGGGGSVLNVTLQNIGADTQPAQPVGTGIRIEEGGTLFVDDTIIQDVERIGIAVFDTGTQAFIDDSSLVGQGEGPGTLNYGIFVGFDGTAQVTDSSFTGFAGTIPVGSGPDQNTSAGILNFLGHLTVGGATFTNNYTGIVIQFADATINPGNFFTSNVAPVAGGGDTSGLNIFDSVVTGTQTVTGPNSEIIFDGLPAGEDIPGGPDDDQLFGDSGDDTITGNGGDDDIDGGSDTDTARYSGNSSDYTFLQLTNGDIQVTDHRAGSPDGTDTVRNVEFFEFDNATLAANALPNLATPGPDILIGDNGPNTIDGQGGEDQIFGNGGDDNLSGGTGDDRMNGGDGNDTMSGGDGVDQMYGGTGNDTMRGDEGDDRMNGEEGDDLMFGGTGDDLMLANGGNDNMFGDDGNDRLDGGDGNDRITGGAGDDFLTGGLGRDQMVGSAGADRYDFNALAESVVGANRDVVYFEHDGDRIDLSNIDANSTVGGNQAFTFIGGSAFSSAGQLRFSSGVLQADVNGDGNADFEVRVVTGSLASGDFFL